MHRQNKSKLEFQIADNRKLFKSFHRQNLSKWGFQIADTSNYSNFDRLCIVKICSNQLFNCWRSKIIQDYSHFWQGMHRQNESKLEFQIADNRKLFIFFDNFDRLCIVEICRNGGFRLLTIQIIQNLTDYSSFTLCGATT